MTLQAFHGGVFPDIPLTTSTSSVLTLDAAGEKGAVIFRVPKTGNIRKIHFLTGTVTTWQNLRVSTQAVDAATGDPTGTVVQSGIVTGLNTDDNIWKSATLSSDHAGTRGDLLSVVFEFDSTVGNLVINNATLSGTSVDMYNVYPDLYTGAWAKQARGPILILEYSDGSFIYTPGLLPIVPVALTTFNTGSTPDEVALRFSLPVPMKVAGASFLGRLTGDCDLVLYDAANTVLASASLDKDVIQSTAADVLMAAIFNTEVTLSASTIYRLAVKPTTATNVRLMYGDAPSNDALDAMAGGKNMYWSQRTDAGSWTDTTTRRPMIALLPSAFDDGAGGGSIIVIDD